MSSTFAYAEQSVPLSAHAELARGQVALLAEDDIHVRIGQQRRACLRAASCMLAPEPGDEVLIALEGERAGWVLAVLQRASDSPARLCVGDNAELAVSGKLRIMAGEELALMSPKRLQVSSRAIQLSAKLAEAAVDQVSAVGANLQTHFGQVRTLADKMDHVATRLVQRIKRRYQFIEDSDQLRAREVDMRANELLSMQGKQTVLTAEQVVKVDGDQVHVG